MVIKKWFVYILTNRKNWTLYTWVTSNLELRIKEHKIKKYKWFTERYWCDILVWFNEFISIDEAIEREKRIKWRTRKKKIILIEKNNPLRNNLSEE